MSDIEGESVTKHYFEVSHIKANPMIKQYYFTRRNGTEESVKEAFCEECGHEIVGEDYRHDGKLICPDCYKNIPEEDWETDQNKLINKPL